MRNPGRVFARAELIERLVDSGFAGLSSTLNVHIRNLRLKIEPEPSNPRYVETVFGIGYRFHREITRTSDLPVVTMIASSVDSDVRQ